MPGGINLPLDLSEEPCRECEGCLWVAGWWGIEVSALSAWHLRIAEALIEAQEVLDCDTILVRV